MAQLSIATLPEEPQMSVQKANGFSVESLFRHRLVFDQRSASAARGWAVAQPRASIRVDRASYPLAQNDVDKLLL